MRGAALALMGVLAAWPAAAYEPTVRLGQPIAQTLAPYGQYLFTITNKLGDRTGAVIDLPVMLSAQACNKRFLIFQINTSASPDASDIQGRRNFQVWLDPKANQVQVEIVDLPTIEGVRAKDTFGYSYPLLDQPNLGQLCGRVSRLNVQVYFNESNVLVTAQRNGAPIAAAYDSPVNMGVGDTMMNKLRTASQISISGTLGDGWGAAVPPVRISPFYWWPVSGDADTHSNLNDDINLNYGARTYPVRGPLLDRGSAAAAVMNVIQAH